MQPQGQFDRILDICKSFSQDFLNSCGNLQHCGRKPRCSDVEIIALYIFQEFLSIDSECLFFDTMQSLLPDLALRMGSRRNYNARRHHLAYHIEQIRARIIKSILNMASTPHRKSVTTTDWCRGENVIPRSSAPPIYTPMLFVCSPCADFSSTSGSQM